MGDVVGGRYQAAWAPTRAKQEVSSHTHSVMRTIARVKLVPHKYNSFVTRNDWVCFAVRLSGGEHAANVLGAHRHLSTQGSLDIARTLSGLPSTSNGTISSVDLAKRVKREVLQYLGGPVRWSNFIISTGGNAPRGILRNLFSQLFYPQLPHHRFLHKRKRNGD